MASKRFKYRLEKVLEMKKQKEEEEKEKLGKLIAAEAHERQVKVDLETKLANVQYELKTRRLATGSISIEDLRFFPGHIKNLEAKIKYQELRLQELAIKIVEQREALANAIKERKTYEKHKEKCLEEWTKEQDAEEARLLDELATIKFAREFTQKD